MQDREALEQQIASDVRALTAESDQIGREFATRNNVASNDFRALLHVMVADAAGAPLTAGELRKLMGTSGAAITYLVERMIASGHLRRETHAQDRRKVILRYDDHGLAVAHNFFAPLQRLNSQALAGLPDEDLQAAHRVFTALVAAMREFQAADDD
ncbi:MarR family winged helix-turn-helix transcriptional regulator [Mycobacterium sp. AMU20-3851]|uniref:MarR family winged helix-turn-helix transcriptional regulator n=1 Tax=Mycobacterium sp. AMU20-3851 TaxID=3122055 RepID=UPI003754DD1B